MPPSAAGDAAAVLDAQEVDEGGGQRDAEQGLGLPDVLVGQGRLNVVGAVAPERDLDLVEVRHPGSLGP